MKVREAITRMGFYEPPLSERTGEEQLLLDFNESSLPPPPEVIEALIGFLRQGNIHRYPLSQGLVEKLARYAGAAPEEILITNGSDQALDVILRALLEAGDEMVFARPGFAMIPHIAETIGARVVSTQYRPDMGFPFEETLEAVSSSTRLIVLINPNNPTGTAIAPEAIEKILGTFPEIPVLVDEAYYEFNGDTSVPFIKRHANLVIARTFSKAFALAGLRLGYAVSNVDFIRELHKIRGPFDVNIMAIKAAEAMLDHMDQVRAYTREVMTQAKPMVERFFQEHGVTYFRGAANFMLVRPGNTREAYQFLKARKILVRPQPPPIADTFRLSVGTVEEMNRFLQVYAQYLQQGGDGGG